MDHLPCRDARTRYSREQLRRAIFGTRRVNLQIRRVIHICQVTAQFLIAFTSLLEEITPLRSGALQRRIKQLIYLSPAFKLHRPFPESIHGIARPSLSATRA